MAKTVYVDSVNGSNSNDGLSWVNAKLTIAGARAATTAGDRVLIAPGVYFEGNVSFGSANDVDVLYMADPTQAGLVIVDFQNSPSFTPGYGFGSGFYDGAYFDIFQARVSFLNILFKNIYPTGCSFFRSTQAGSTNPRFYHCIFWQQTGGDNTGMALQGYNSAAQGFDLYNCTFYNLDIAWRRFTGIARNCYVENCTTVNSGASISGDYNAYPGNVEANGINTTTGANPGMVAPDNQDFRLDPVSIPADYATFMNGGEYGQRISAYGRGGTYYNAIAPQLLFLSPVPSAGNPQPAWENEGPGGTNTYTTGTPGDIVEDGTTNELKLDLTGSPTGGRVRSDVLDLGIETVKILSISLGGFEDLANGAAFDTNNTLPQKIEYRSSNVSFAKGDATPSWIEITRGEYLNVSHRYVQVRVEFRTDHTNA